MRGSHGRDAVGRAGRGAGILVLLGGIGFAAMRLSAGAEPVLAWRALLIGCGLGTWFLTQSLLGARPPVAGTRRDPVHRWTARWNARLHANPPAANGLLIGSSLLIDLFGLFLLGSALFGPTMRPGAALLLLFALRQGCQFLWALPPPPGMIWRSPGFPSLLVTYGVSNDFFFSGHTAIAVLGAIEIGRVAPWWAAAIAGGIAFLEALVVLVLRAHWTVDVLAGAAAAGAAAGIAAAMCA
jgi:hypothetical protein